MPWAKRRVIVPIPAMAPVLSAVRRKPRTLGSREIRLLAELADVERDLARYERRRADLAYQIMRERLDPWLQKETDMRYGIRRVVCVLAMLFAGATSAWAADGVSLVGTRVILAEEQPGVTSFALGMPLSAAWSANPAADQVSRYEYHLDAAAPTSTGLSLSVTLPQAQLTLGSHSVAVRACNTSGCGPELTAQFSIVLALPTIPTGLRIQPATAPIAINRKQGEDYVFGYCMWAIDRSCTRTEQGVIEARLNTMFPGVPATKWNLLEALNSLNAELLVARFW